MMIRPHFLTSGDALNRRRIQELFLQVASQLNELSGMGIMNGQFDRSNFNMDTWEEYQSDYATEIRFIAPVMGQTIPAAALNVTCDDSFMEGELTWSIAINPSSASASNMVMAVPTLCGIPLFAGEDWSETDQLIYYTKVAGVATDPADASLENDACSLIVDAGLAPYGISLGNTVGFTGLNGRGRAGIMIFSIGEFKVKACSISCRKVLR